jgi:hypothetical protein
MRRGSKFSQEEIEGYYHNLPLRPDGYMKAPLPEVNVWQNSVCSDKIPGLDRVGLPAPGSRALARTLYLRSWKKKGGLKFLPPKQPVV